MTDSRIRQCPSGPANGLWTPPNVGTTNRTQRWTTNLDGLKLRQLRRQHGLSQAKLADEAGVSLTTMTRLERQHRSPCRTYTLARLAVALGEPLTSIMFSGPQTS
jgi:DNA-binding XRE family transcriptional regulator